MIFFCILLTMLLGGIFMFSGCDESKDLYNPEHTQEKAKEAFPVKDIDPDQTWETSTVCNASVSIEEKTGETYTIKVYTANPYNTDNNPSRERKGREFQIRHAGCIAICICDESEQ